jgi:hypothetical protein
MWANSAKPNHMYEQLPHTAYQEVHRHQWTQIQLSYKPIPSVQYPLTSWTKLHRAHPAWPQVSTHMQSAKAQCNLLFGPWLSSMIGSNFLWDTTHGCRVSSVNHCESSEITVIGHQPTFQGCSMLAGSESGPSIVSLPICFSCFTPLIFLFPPLVLSNLLLSLSLDLQLS